MGRPMTAVRVAELRQWLSMCQGAGIPKTEWMCVVEELLGAVEAYWDAIPSSLDCADLLDCLAAAKVCKVAPRTVMKWCDMGRLKCTRDEKTGNRWITRDDLNAFVRQYRDVFDSSGFFSGKSKGSKG